MTTELDHIWPYSLEGIRSQVQLNSPDKAAYERQKHVLFIKHEVAPFPDSKLALPYVDWVGDSWQAIHGPLIEVSARGLARRPNKWPRVFPGPVVPGPKLTSQYIGSTAFEVFQHMLSIKERLIDPQALEHTERGYRYLGPQPGIELKPVDEPEKWFWDIPAPALQRLQLGDSGTTLTDTVAHLRRDGIEELIKKEVFDFWEKFKDGERNGVKEILELIQIIQSPHVRNEIPENVVFTALNVLSVLEKQKDYIDIEAVLFQLESSLMYAYKLTGRNVFAKGLYGSAWIEIAHISADMVKSTELVDERRAINEVINLIERGWAPLIVDERNNNTDGSHRGIAFRVWNLMKTFSSLGLLNHDSENKITDHMQSAASGFIESSFDMRGLTLRETLRVTQELLLNPAYAEQKNRIISALPNNGVIRFLPTVLLREQEACCVVKDPFDKEGVVIGIDPMITVTLTADGRSNYALGSRGPYHRTDKTPLPWINIFDLQKL